MLDIRMIGEYRKDDTEVSAQALGGMPHGTRKLSIGGTSASTFATEAPLAYERVGAAAGCAPFAPS
jgi:hypothetical protein